MSTDIANEIMKTGMRAAFGAEIKGALSQALAQVGCEQHEAIAHNMMERLCECYDACHPFQSMAHTVKEQVDKTIKDLDDYRKRTSHWCGEANAKQRIIESMAARIKVVGADLINMAESKA